MTVEIMDNDAIKTGLTLFGYLTLTQRIGSVVFRVWNPAGDDDVYMPYSVRLQKVDDDQFFVDDTVFLPTWVTMI
jgi:hypothetical protein